MTRDVITVTPSSSLKTAVTLFLAHGISGLPVVEGGRLVGVLSESDIVAKETSGYSNGDLSRAEATHLQRERAAGTVAEAMTPDPVTAEPWTPIWAAADLMAVHDVNRLPVVDPGGSLLGIVTRADLVRAFARSDRAIEREIREHVLQSIDLGPNALEIDPPPRPRRSPDRLAGRDARSRRLTFPLPTAPPMRSRGFPEHGPRRASSRPPGPKLPP
jgi:CBS domain-containing protein